MRGPFLPLYAVFAALCRFCRIMPKTVISGHFRSKSVVCAVLREGVVLKNTLQVPSPILLISYCHPDFSLFHPSCQGEEGGKKEGNREAIGRKLGPGDHRSTGQSASPQQLQTSLNILHFP